MPQFGDDMTNSTTNEPNVPVVMHCTRMAGRAVIRVVGRCNDAQETCNLDLSDCQLMQIPDAVYHLMRNTVLQTCDLSTNAITKIGPSLPKKFTEITHLNLANNKISALPEQMSDLSQLRILNMAHNNLPALPPSAIKMPALEVLDLSYNRIDHVDVNVLKNAPSLRVVNLSENPLSLPCRAALREAFEVVEAPTENARGLQVVLSAPEDDDDWKIE
ncbi:leucine-rich repeat-containing protein 20-like isoform X1 [Neocloeon triangulifer]|uniref:leucine-rich repeat-containing protein 20-like isoform X1 n=2 Tax=Neocloeon triangulifer TaxID=2078957 RepID=UPI00286EC5C8|nr:leucine-rich repeat-containing protein 20-like isoform X1 [Neocloeon triangulifer]